LPSKPLVEITGPLNVVLAMMFSSCGFVVVQSA
jgi:hypothetical protein